MNHHNNDDGKYGVPDLVEWLYPVHAQRLRSSTNAEKHSDSGLSRIWPVSISGFTSS
jgi:hypothetical protein